MEWMRPGMVRAARGDVRVAYVFDRGRPRIVRVPMRFATPSSIAASFGFSARSTSSPGSFCFGGRSEIQRLFTIAQSETKPTTTAINTSLIGMCPTARHA